MGQVRSRRKGAEDGGALGRVQGTGRAFPPCCGEPETAGWVRALGGKLRNPGGIWGSPESLGSPSGRCQEHWPTVGGHVTWR